MSDTVSDVTFIKELTGSQPRLYSYILTLLPNRESARDILQETNVVLWRRRSEFTPGTNFSAWAYKTAYHQVLAHRRDRGRDRHQFSDEVYARLSKETATDLDRLDDRRTALQGCLSGLSDRDQALIQERYATGRSLEDIARKSNLSPGAAATAIYRIRLALRDCMAGRLAMGDSP